MDDRHREAWTPQEPPSDFPERVVQQAMRERRNRPTGSRRNLRVGLLMVAVLTAAAVVLFAIGFPLPRSTGEQEATSRMEVAIGDRAVAVLESGAHLRWQDHDVKQTSGDVFYRVNPGGAFRVETPAGKVEVGGTCFRVRARPHTDKTAKDSAMRGKKEVALAVAGALIGAVTVVTVYEGKVMAAAANGETITLGPGESARMDASGTRRVRSDAEHADAELALKDEAPESPYVEANSHLANEIAGLNRRLRGLEKEKDGLERRLEAARTQLAAAADGAVARERHEFDLSEEDWEKLAEESTIKYRTPCIQGTPWMPEPEALDAMGLAPEDAAPINEAFKRSNQRIRDAILPACAEAVGALDVATTIGAETCTHVLADVFRKSDPKGMEQAREELAMIRAGKKPAPAPGDPVHPMLAVFLALTGEMSAFESDLAKSFGPEEAHRIAYSEDLCASHNTWGGRRKK